jgi:hypothetical protein
MDITKKSKNKAKLTAWLSCKISLWFNRHKARCVFIFIVTQSKTRFSALCHKKDYIMQVETYHYSRYLISVQFDKGFLPASIEAMLVRCVEFLEDLGNLARRDGKRLYATYSVVRGINGYHAHFGVSWLPMVSVRVKTAKMGKQPISRRTVTRLLDENYFFVDNPKQAIKRITYDKKYVTDYIIIQPKEDQYVCESGFYSHTVFVPVCSEIKMRSYCSKQQFGAYQKECKKNHIKTTYLLFLISVAWLILISSILTSIF